MNDPAKLTRTDSARAILLLVAFALLVVLLILNVVLVSLRITWQFAPPAPPPQMVCVHVVEAPGFDLADLPAGTECEPVQR